MTENGGSGRAYLQRCFIAITAASFIFSCINAHGAVAFTDETENAGTVYVGESYGASWGDVNGDLLPDLYVNHHRERNNIWVNLGNGTFEDRSYEVDIWNGVRQFADVHGQSWADFDNDGDDDLMITAGAKDSSQFLVNVNGILTDLTNDYTFDVQSWPGRMALFFDFTMDGLLDFANFNRGASRTFEQTATDFVDVRAATQFLCNDSQYGHIADVTMDGTTDVLCISTFFPDKAYDYTTIPFTNVTPLIGQYPNPVDSIIADLDGDTKNDIVVLLGRTRISGGEIVGPNSAEAHLIPTPTKQVGVTFESNGDVTFVLHWSNRNASNVFIGAAGNHPPFPPSGQPISFTLAASDPSVHGIMPHDPTTTRGIYVGYDPATSTWSYLNAAGGQGNFSYTYTFIDSTAPITNMSDVTLQGIDLPTRPLFLTSSTGSFVDTAAASGLGEPQHCVSVTTADFDNDMDLDLYFVCRNAVSNAANRYYENLGGGNFVEQVGFGAEGPVGPGLGLGEIAVSADYDVDGFVDLFVTNGLKIYPEKPFSYGGPDKLFRNAGNSNNWVQFQLVGTTSNRDAIGATVTVTAGGVTQMRERNGGYHRWSQDWNRLIHFGLASNTTFDVDVRWPTGAIETFTNLSSNQVYQLTEGAPTASTVTIPNTASPSVCATAGGGDPGLDLTTDRGVFAWRDCSNPQVWHVRALAGGAEPLQAVGQVTSTLNFSSVSPVSIEGGDVLNTSVPSEISFQLAVGTGGEDGFNLTFPAGAAVCFRLDLPAEPVKVGHDKINVPGAFELGTLGACSGIVPSISIGSASANEDDGTLSFPVSLSQASVSEVTVAYATNEGSATDPEDYIGESGMVTFPPNTTLQTIEIPLVDDAVSEATEMFSVSLSDPVNAVLGIASGTGTINDDEPSSCGPITFNAGAEQGVFVSRNCATDVWSVRVTAGGGTATYTGRVTASQPFGSVSGFSLETADVLDTSNPAEVEYSLVVGGTGVDGFDFTVPGGAEACLDVDTPAGIMTFIGAERAILNTPVDLVTQTPCSSILPELTVQPVAVSEDEPTGMVQIDVTLSNPSASTVTVEYTTADDTATAGNDYVAKSGLLTFVPGDVMETVDVTLLDDDLSEGDEMFGLTLFNPSNASLDAVQGQVTIQDNELSQCGSDPFNPNTDPGVFVFRDCTTDVWSLRIVGGGGPYTTYTGSLTAQQPFTSVNGFSLEGSDVVDNTTTEVINYSLSVGGAGVDGIDFTLSSLQGICVRLESGPTQTAFIGNALTPIEAPFDLGTLGPCLDVVPEIAVADTQLAEDDVTGIMNFTVSLSAPSGLPVSVDYTTADGDAIAPDDYLSTAGTIVFDPGETEKLVPVTIVDDVEGEGNELFTLELTAPINGTIGDNSGTGTILDNEGVSTLTIDDVVVDETDLIATFTVATSQSSGAPIMVAYDTADGTATAGEDYVAASNIATIDPGQFSTTIEITLSDDNFAEGDEGFTISLTSPINAIIGDGQGTATIQDDEPSPCGPQAIVPASEQGVFLAKNCGTDSWQLRVTEGGGPYVVTQGNLDASQAFQNVNGFSFEGADSVINSPANEISFSLGVGGSGIDGIDFDHPTGRDTCVSIDFPPGRQILVGAAKTPITPPFDLGTLGPCGSGEPLVTIDSVSVDENEVTGFATFNVSLSAAAGVPVMVNYSTNDGTAVNPDDYLSSSDTLTFNPGETSLPINIPIVDDFVSEGEEAFTVALSTPVNATLGAASTGTATVFDDEPSPCGPAVFNAATEQGVFIHRNCGTDQWSVRVSQGGGAYVFFNGQVTAPQPFLSVTGFSLESADVIDATVPGQISYSLGVGGSGIDGIDFSIPTPSGVCFTLNTPSVPVFLGANRTPVSNPFDLETLQVCP